MKYVKQNKEKRALGRALRVATDKVVLKTVLFQPIAEDMPWRTVDFLGAMIAAPAHNLFPFYFEVVENKRFGLSHSFVF